MRVVAGSLGGRSFKAPTGHKTHPMGERVRGGLFNVLGDISGLSVLDAFAGSGALSLEALSRGANRAVAIDNDRRAHDTLIKNVYLLGLNDKLRVVKANVSTWVDAHPDELFDLVFCDPPYDQIKQDMLQKIASRAKPGGAIVFSLPPKAVLVLTSNFELLTSKSYGDAQLAFYRKLS